jgi:hypothetical protein
MTIGVGVIEGIKEGVMFVGVLDGERVVVAIMVDVSVNVRIGISA